MHVLSNNIEKGEERREAPSSSSAAAVQCFGSSRVISDDLEEGFSLARSIPSPAERTAHKK